MKNLNPKKIPLIILGITSLVCSRTMLLLLNDPEGPNLLVVIGMALIVYLLSFAVYSFNTLTKNVFLKILLVILFQIIIAVVFVYQNNKTAHILITNYKDATYLIDGENVTLKNGKAEIEVVPGSASKNIFRYFGNELKTDLNNDGLEDVVFLLTKQTSGSGTFFYVVAALKKENGYVGSDGYFLGNRIAPQNINNSLNPKHKNVIVVNYADRTPNESFTTRASIGKSTYLKLDTQTMKWGIVVPNFEGESR